MRIVQLPALKFIHFILLAHSVAVFVFVPVVCFVWPAKGVVVVTIVTFILFVTFCSTLLSNYFRPRSSALKPSRELIYSSTGV